MTALRDYVASVRQPVLGAGAVPYDEVVDAEGSLRPAWRAVAAQAMDLTDIDLRRTAHQLGRYLDDDGVTYGRPGERHVRWRLDPLPIILTAEEWAPLEVGLAQRTELLDAVLADLQGPQRLLREGVLPPALVLGHGGFLRALRRDGTTVPAPLTVAAADLARTDSGEWQVVADRTQAPSGIGYVLENRHVMSRALPSLHREVPVHQVEPFLQLLRGSLAEAAPDGVADPRIVVLTPGASSETAFDQAHLASALGFPLVQGSDLVVRSGALWTRVYGQLERVDVVLRRVDALWSDPLELRGDSRLGVPGLLEVARRGRVSVVNDLGAGVLENIGLMPFMSRLCEVLLDEPLRLPSRPVHWLGDPRARRRWREDPTALEVRSIDHGTVLDDPPEVLLAKVESAPHGYVASEPVQWSQAPHVDAGSVQRGAVSLRTFTIRHGSSYRPLLGGLASVLQDGRTIASKDVWVLKGSPDEPDQGLHDVVASAGSTTPPALVPRVLENLFWFGRHAVRAEDTVRLVLVAHGLDENFRARTRSSGGEALRVVRETLDVLSAGERDLADPWSIDADLRELLGRASRDGSVAHSLSALHDVAQSVRDQLSLDVWRALGVADRAVASLAESPRPENLDDAGEQVLTGLLALHGTTAGMVRDDGWHALQVGKSLERALQVCRLLRHTVTTLRPIDADRHVHDAVLTAAESSVTHRRRHRGRVRLIGLLELLLADRSNPRSLAANLLTLGESLEALPMSTGATRPERLLEDLLEETERVELVDVIRAVDDVRPDLVRHLETLTAHLARLSEAVTDLHLRSTPAPRSFGLVTRRTS